MAKARFAYVNLLTVSGVVISSSSDLTDRPDDFLANPARWKKWRSATSTGDQWVKFDLGSNQSMQALLLADWVAHSSGGTIKAQANATDSWGAPTVDVTLTLPSPNPTKVIGTWLGSVESLRWVRFYFTNTGAVNEFVELGVAFAGVYFEPTYNVVDGFQWQRVDPSLIVAAEGGQEESHARTHFYMTRGSFRDMPGSDKDSFIAMFETNGQRVPMFFGTDPDDMDELVYGRLAGALPTPHAYGDVWHVPIEFRESR